MSIFTQAIAKTPGYSQFDLSHDVKLSYDLGELIPTLVLECLPGDRFKIRPQNMVRFDALLAPAMHRYRVKTELFFVPFRLLWANWDDWIAGQTDVEVTPPTYGGMDRFDAGTIADYLGYPDGGANNSTYQVSAFPLAAYYRIYDYFYRDENLEAEKFQILSNGYNAYYHNLIDDQPFVRAWMHDYFTSCLPFAQKGDAVTIPLLTTDSVDVVSKGAGNVSGMIFRGVSDFIASTADDVVSGGSGTIEVGAQGSHTIDPNGDLEVNINPSAQTIETLRVAYRLQEWLELNARGGTRYSELMKAHFGVISPDARLNEPEYIGGTSTNMVISEVLATAENTATSTPIGDIKGHGIAVDRGNTITYRCQEHGLIMALTSVTPVTAYYQGLPREFNRKTPYDYYWPTFANLGDQEVYNSEIYVGNETNATMNEVFGYGVRYSEYKYKNSRVCGTMKGTLEYWHHARKFASLPALNETFIKCVPDKRIFAVTAAGVDSLFSHMYFDIKAIRPMPKYALPMT